MNTIVDIRPAVDHLKAQLGSLLRMRDLLLEQQEAVENSDATKVLQAVALLKAELANRVSLEETRERLLAEWAEELDCLPGEISAAQLADLDPACGPEIRSLSRQVHEEALTVQSLHSYVQALLRSELNFVSCLVDALYPNQQTGVYAADGSSDERTFPRSLDVRS